MKTTIIIPARYASSRYPGKPLARLKGADGTSKTLIQRSWEAAISVRDVDDVFVATDDARIAEEAAGFGAEVLMTSPDCRNGTERCAEALSQLDRPDVIINLQGDAPLTPPWFVEALIDTMRTRPEVEVATPVLRCDAETLASFRADRKAGRVGGTTAVFDETGRALYFSKEVIPFADALDGSDPCPVFHHVGVYAYRSEGLRDYLAMRPGGLEAIEGLEQLRFMERSRIVHCVEVEARGAGFWELNNPEDVPRIERYLKERGMV